MALSLTYPNCADNDNHVQWRDTQFFYKKSDSFLPSLLSLSHSVLFGFSPTIDMESVFIWNRELH